MRLALLLLMLSVLPTPAFAQAPVVFRDAVKDQRESAALSMLISKGIFVKDLPYMVAAVDLNDDGVAEWIFRQDRESACEANTNCRFIIAGLSEGSPIILGDVSARKIGIASQKSYGVLRIYVYNKKDNDFAYSSYGWSPKSGSFQPF